jgi:8-oxo-dGTP diphosphatase
MEKEITDIYGSRVRVRVCGLCWSGDKLLMVKHKSLKANGFWAPPGGGIDFSQTIEETLQREFLEETGLLVNPGAFRFGCEFIQNPLHALELFYTIDQSQGSVRNGYDPEIQLIEEVKYLSPEELKAIPKDNLHSIFHNHQTKMEIEKLSGFYRI